MKHRNCCSKLLNFIYTSLAFLCFCSVTHAQFHTIDLLGDKKEIELPMKYEQGFIIVKVFLDGVIPLNMIFDTGAENTVIFDRIMLDLLDIPLNETVQILGADRNSYELGHIARRVPLQFEKGQKTAMDLIVLDDLDLELNNLIGEDIDGILGANFLLGAVVQIDYVGKVLRIIRPDFFKKPWRFKKQDISIVRQRPFIEAKICLKDSEPVDINLLLDTGASIHMLIDEYSHPDLIMPDTVIDGRIGTGLGGELGGFLGTIDQIDFLDYRFRELPVYFQKTDSIALANDYVLNSRNGIIGNIFWERNKLIIDYNESKVYYRSRKRMDKPYRFNRSGLVVFAVGHELDEYIVKQVFEGSAAAEAGVQAGDVIRRINWVPHFFLNIGVINRFLTGKEGKKIKLIVNRSGKREKIEFKLSQRKIDKSRIVNREN